MRGARMPPELSTDNEADHDEKIYIRKLQGP
jgi:hypothetical protein